MDAKLSPETRIYLENLARRQKGVKDVTVGEPNENRILDNEYVYIFYFPVAELLFTVSERKLA